MLASELLYFIFLQVLSVPGIVNYWVASKFISKITTPIWVVLLYDYATEPWVFVVGMSLLVLNMILFVYFFRITQRKLDEITIVRHTDNNNILN